VRTSPLKFLATRYAQLEKMKILLKEKAITQIAHLVFPNTKFQRLKNQKSNFLPTLDRNHRRKCKFVTY